MAMYNLKRASTVETVDNLEVFVRGNIYIDFFNWMIHYVCGTIISNTFIKAISGTNMLESTVIGGRAVNPAKIVKVIRIIIFVVLFTFFSLWGFATNVHDYIFYRRCSFAALSGIVLVVPQVILTFFGNRVIKAMERTASVRSKGAPPTERVVSLKSKAVLAASNKSKAVSPVVIKTVDEQERRGRVASNAHKEGHHTSSTPSKIVRLRFLLNLTMFGIYVPTAIMCSMAFIGNEYFQDAPQALLSLKVIMDGYLLVIHFFLTFYLK
jgi:hypothetical protein